MNIIPMTEADIKDVAALEKQCFSAPWSAQSLGMELKNKCALFYIAREGDDLLGYIGMHAVLDEGYIANVAVDERFRRRRVATALLGQLVEYAATRHLGFITLEVRESNGPAIAFYTKNQFGVVGRRKNYYSAPAEDALLMTRFFGRAKEASL